MTAADWYFDFISPYSYFASLQLHDLSSRLNLRYRPVLFAGLLNHWEQKGPAEIPTKRQWTYRWCTWWADQHGIPFSFPQAHPFNPISFLRLALAANCSSQAIHTIFRALWTTGADAGNPQLAIELARQLNVDPATLERQTIKDALRQETNRAIENGVFGVPTLCVDGHLFWGADANQLVEAYLADRTLFDSVEMRRVSTLPVGISRRFSP
jgi:2-hydroxychromene-2-carboxylate isomerase